MWKSLMLGSLFVFAVLCGDDNTDAAVRYRRVYARPALGVAYIGRTVYRSWVAPTVTYRSWAAPAATVVVTPRPIVETQPQVVESPPVETQAPPTAVYAEPAKVYSYTTVPRAAVSVQTPWVSVQTGGHPPRKVRYRARW